MRKILIVLFWFPAAFIFLLLNLTMLASMRSSGLAKHKLSASPLADTGFQLAASAGTSQILGTKVIAADARALLLELFLERHQSPIAPYADALVSQADLQGIDFRLATAIAMCESNAGKRIPPRSYNAWGIAVYTGQQSGAQFDNWPHAIEWVSKYIKEKYYDKGLIDLKDIGAKWAPPSVQTDYSWTKCVESFQNEIF
ncbi:hypothetical protein HY948_04575 [Candidatus Gottesmanbacteria bacterium]|nr:hypothetical protein [Candidatus Gottesmanbacteria bacterium]